MPLPAVILLAVLAMISSARAGQVQGQVLWNGQGVSAARVEAFGSPERAPAGSPLASTAAGPDGSFTLNLPEGTYWLRAQGAAVRGGREVRLAGPAAQRPVSVGSSGDPLRVDLVVAEAGGLVREPTPTGSGVRGRVSGGDPSAVVVYAYPGRAERPVGPGFVAAVPLDPEGGFQLDLAPGTYTLAARSRADRAPFGGMAVGDLVAVAPAEVPAETVVEVPTLVLHAVDPEILKTITAGTPESRTAVEGSVVLADRQPAAGLRVLAFTDPNLSGKPTAVSSPVGPDGSFRLWLPGAGTYFLGARATIGGPPQPGERVGVYPGNASGGLTVAAGETIRDVVIPVAESR